jgi:predicted TIM-barrel fold metal-dependent hydrolase
VQGVRRGHAEARAAEGGLGPVAPHRVLKVDLHTHILPESLPDLTERYGTPGFIQLDHHAPGCARMILDGALFREIQDNCWDPRRRLEDCAATQVDVQVLSTVPVMFNYWAKPEHTLDLSTLLNDHVASVVDGNPNRFVGLGTLPMQQTDLAIYELERCVRDLSSLECRSARTSTAGPRPPRALPDLRSGGRPQRVRLRSPWDISARSA